MSRVMRVACGVLAAGFFWAQFEMLRDGKPIASLPLTMMTLVFAFYAVRGRQRPAYGEPGATGLDRPLPAAQVIIYLVLVFAAFVVLFLIKAHRL